jgi:hypothetical protein
MASLPFEMVEEEKDNGEKKTKKTTASDTRNTIGWNSASLDMKSITQSCSRRLNDQH